MKAIKPNTNDDWLVVVNPNAGRRKGEKDWGRIAELLEEANISFVSVFTQRKYQAIQLTKKHVEKDYKKIIVVGGDGTLNEVINGVYHQKKYPATEISVGIIPVGTGNDWCRMYGISLDYQEAIKIIAAGTTFIQDAALVHFYDGDMPNSRYLINMAGIGYDALVAQKTNTQKERGKGGPLSYFYNIFYSLFKWNPVNTHIKVDDEKIPANIFSINVGINRFNGNGLKQLPFARPNDGLIDVTIIRKVGKMLVIRSLKKLYDGTFVTLPQVSTHKGQKITIESKNSRKLNLEADGESLGHSPFSFEIIPKAVQMYVPQEAKQQFEQFTPEKQSKAAR
ncbi:MAG: diacylglycerol kinase family lipid kinase [Bacteroidales bacterium]|nr:diacylglycerol kinase family lipid kinase [Bacteroidales bacterium]MCF8332518.1 diacylglycerol kinase family lipid kinase [Bacteroidales bacterium]